MSLIEEIVATKKDLPPNYKNLAQEQTVWVRSRKGRDGSIFDIDLPIITDPENRDYRVKIGIDNDKEAWQFGCELAKEIHGEARFIHCGRVSREETYYRISSLLRC